MCVSGTTGSIPEYKDCLVFLKTYLSCVLTHCDVSRTPRLNYSFAFNQASCIILYVIHHCFPTAQKTEWQQDTQWASTWGALNLSIISIVLRKILLCGKNRLEQPFQRLAAALKLFPITCANSEATEFSHRLVYVPGIWYRLNQKYIYLFILNTKWLLNVLLLTFNCIQTLKFNLCEINELVVSRVYMFNQKITFGVLEGILIDVYQEGSRYSDTNPNAKYINTHACNYLSPLPWTF